MNIRNFSSTTEAYIEGYRVGCDQTRENFLNVLAPFHEPAPVQIIGVPAGFELKKLAKVLMLHQGDEPPRPEDDKRWCVTINSDEQAAALEAMVQRWRTLRSTRQV